jgi:hypothetical protein
LTAPERKVAVVALVEGFDERVATSAKSGGDLRMAHPRAASDVDGPPAQMIAITYATHPAVVLG